MALQDYFLSALKKQPGALVTPAATDHRGHFLTFETPQAETFYNDLLKRGVTTDYRGTRLRFGFGIYHDRDDVDRLIAALDF
jgi:kynureninase